MKGLIWTIILFAVAAALAVGASVYSGNVYVVAEQTMIRINLIEDQRPILLSSHEFFSH